MTSSDRKLSVGWLGSVGCPVYTLHCSSVHDLLFDPYPFKALPTIPQELERLLGWLEKLGCTGLAVVAVRPSLRINLLVPTAFVVREAS